LGEVAYGVSQKSYFAEGNYRKWLTV